MRFSPAERTLELFQRGFCVLALSLVVTLGWVAESTAQRNPRLRVGVGRSIVLTLRDSIGTVSIADDKVADVVVATPRQVLIVGKKVGVTTLVVWGRGSRFEQYDLVVHRGELAGNQIVLNVKVIEVNRNKLRETGVDFGILRVNDDFLGGSGLFGSFAGQLAPPSFPPIFSQNTTIALDFVSLGADTRITAMIEALEQSGVAKTLASPNLVAVNGQKASFLSGGEIPIPIVQSAQVSAGAGGGSGGSITVLFKEFGVKLEFEPTIIDSNIVSLKVKPELSRPDFENAVILAGSIIPSFITRRVETVVEMKEGETLVIGGLKNERVLKTVSRIPILSSIPVLGNLFKKVRSETIEEELIVMVTPHFVQPIPAGQVPEFPNLSDPE